MLVSLRMSELRDRFFTGGELGFLVIFRLGEDLIGGSRGGAHEETWRSAVSENLGILLEVDLTISADVDVVEEVFYLLVLWHFFCSLFVEFLQHLVELFKAEVSGSRVVPLQ